MENLIIELIQAIRGDKSQNALSIALGFEDNRVNRWEKKQRPIYWDDFVKLCQVERIDLTASLEYFMNYGDGLDASSIIDFLTSSLNQKQLQEKIAVTAQTIGRWKSGKSTPTLINVFDLIKATRDVAIEIIHDIAKRSGTIPAAIEQEYNLKLKHKDLAFNYPEANLINLCYHLTDMANHQFEDDAAFIATKIGNNDLQRIRQILKLHEEIGKIERVSEGRYRRLPDSLKFNILRSNMDLQRAGHLFWVNKAKDILETSDLEEEKFHRITITSNQKLKETINEKIKKLFIEINTLSEEAERAGETMDILQTVSIQDYLLNYPDKK